MTEATLGPEVEMVGGSTPPPPKPPRKQTRPPIRNTFFQILWKLWAMDIFDGRHLHFSMFLDRLNGDRKDRGKGRITEKRLLRTLSGPRRQFFHLDETRCTISLNPTGKMFARNLFLSNPIDPFQQFSEFREDVLNRVVRSEARPLTAAQLEEITTISETAISEIMEIMVSKQIAHYGDPEVDDDGKEHTTYRISKYPHHQAKGRGHLHGSTEATLIILHLLNTDGPKVDHALTADSITSLAKAGGLLDIYGVSKGTLSKALSTLSAHGFVTADKSGPGKTKYTITAAGTAEAEAAIESREEQQERIDRSAEEALQEVDLDAIANEVEEAESEDVAAAVSEVEEKAIEDDEKEQPKFGEVVREGFESPAKNAPEVLGAEPEEDPFDDGCGCQCGCEDGDTVGAPPKDTHPRLAYYVQVDEETKGAIEALATLYGVTPTEVVEMLVKKQQDRIRLV